MWNIKLNPIYPTKGHGADMQGWFSVNRLSKHNRNFLRQTILNLIVFYIIIIVIYVLKA